MKTGRVFVVHLRQLLSWKLPVCSIVLAALQVLAAAGLMDENASVWYLLLIGNATGVTFFTLYLLPAFSYAPSLSQEWNAHAVPYWIIRTGVGRYTLSKMLVCALSGFLTVYIGMGIFSVIAGFFIPPYAYQVTVDSYETLMQNGHPWFALMGYWADNGLSGAIVAALGMTVSVFVTNPFVAATAPLAILLVLSRLAAQQSWPPVFNAAEWMSTNTTALTVSRALLEKGVLTVVLLFLMGCAAVWRMKRRMRDEA